MRMHPRGPVATASRTWRRATGPMITLAARVTYDLAPLRCEIATQPEPLRASDVWSHAEDGTKVPCEPADLAPMKIASDIILVGTAFAPNGVPAREVMARLVVGELDKAVRVTGPRSFAPDGTLTPPATFREAPLDWTHAAGGEGTWNPLGVSADLVGMGPTPAPTLLPHDVDSPKRGEYTSPAGFGPIPLEWSPRRSRVTELTREWLETARVGEPFWPEDGDPRMFQAAPPDQQLARPLRSDERIVLENLHRSHARLVTSLPGVELRAAVIDGHGRHRTLALLADTLWFDTTRSIATVTHRVSMPAGELLHHDVFVWLDGFDQHVRADMADLAGETMQPDVRRGLELPFRETGPVSRSQATDDDDYERLATGTIAAEPSPAVGRASVPFVSTTATAEPHRVAARVPPAPPPPTHAGLVSAPALIAPPLIAPASTAVAPAPAWVPPSVPKPAAAPAIDTWKLHEEAQARRGPDEGAMPVEPRPDVPTAATPGASTDARATGRTPIEVVWVDGPRDIDLAKVSMSLREQLGGDGLEDEWASAADSGGAVELARRDVARMFRDAKVVELDRVAMVLQAQLAEAPTERPHLVLAGELVWSFDPAEALRAWIAIGTPMSADPRIKEAIEHAERMRVETLAAVPDVLGAAVERLRDAIKSVTKMVGATPIEAAAERYIIEERGFGRRRLWGDRKLRAHLHGRSRHPIPVYFPDPAGWAAPLMQRLPSRVLGELRNRQDPTEASPVCVRAVAFGVELATA